MILFSFFLCFFFQPLCDYINASVVLLTCRESCLGVKDRTDVSRTSTLSQGLSVLNESDLCVNGLTLISVSMTLPIRQDLTSVSRTSPLCQGPHLCGKDLTSVTMT